MNGPKNNTLENKHDYPSWATENSDLTELIDMDYPNNEIHADTQANSNIPGEKQQGTSER